MPDAVLSMRFFKMNYQSMLLVLSVLIGLSCTPISAALNIRNRPHESDRSRKRDEWQRPGEVMDAMGVKQGHRVADIGSGFGYFTFRLAARVGAEGKVYAVDIDRESINKVRER